MSKVLPVTSYLSGQRTSKPERKGRLINHSRSMANWIWTTVNVMCQLLVSFTRFHGLRMHARHLKGPFEFSFGKMLGLQISHMLILLDQKKPYVNTFF